MNPIHERALSERDTLHSVKDFILGRWSPRAMNGEILSEEELMTLFDAARWAPSAYNEQPWRFIYANRETPEWNKLNGLLVDFNQEWCETASTLVVICSTNTFKLNDKPNPTHSFDTGAAWMALALQGASMGLVVHGMSGFDYEKARTELSIPDNVTVEAMFAIGKPAPKESLEGKLLEMENPSDRNPIDDFLMHGSFHS
jgi:nitroreductase